MMKLPEGIVAVKQLKGAKFMEGKLHLFDDCFLEYAICGIARNRAVWRDMRKLAWTECPNDRCGRCIRALQRRARFAPQGDH